MKPTRRTFIKAAGLAALGLGIKPTIDLVGGGQHIEASSQAAAEPTAATKRWAMVVDTTKCPEGCTDCIDACHHTHNVPHFDNPKEEVKWIWHDSYEHVFPDQENEFARKGLNDLSVLLMCNHCDNPSCVRVCPTKATFKRAQDGIVMMDMHRCIGCRFCMAACPYGSRSFNWKDPRLGLDMKNLNPDYPTRTRGVVEKCTFCAERIDKGLNPACVEACKKKALVFGNVEDPESPVRKLLDANYTLRRRVELGTGPRVYYIV